MKRGRIGRRTGTAAATTTTRKRRKEGGREEGRDEGKKRQKRKIERQEQEQEQSHTFVEAVRLVSTVPACIATAKTLLTTHASVRRHLPLGNVHVLDQSPTAVCATRREF